MIFCKKGHQRPNTNSEKRCPECYKVSHRRAAREYWRRREKLNLPRTPSETLINILDPNELMEEKVRWQQERNTLIDKRSDVYRNEQARRDRVDRRIARLDGDIAALQRYVDQLSKALPQSEDDEPMF